VLKPHGLSLPENPVDADAHKVTNAVIDAIGVTTDWAKDQIFRQAKYELTQHPGELDAVDAVFDGMVRAWEAYIFAAQKDRLKCTCNAEKFFGEGRWKSSKRWGFKRGYKAYCHDFEQHYAALPPLPVLQSSNHVEIASAP
jgi:hypothetical protein